MQALGFKWKAHEQQITGSRYTNNDYGGGHTKRQAQQQAHEMAGIRAANYGNVHTKHGTAGTTTGTTASKHNAQARTIVWCGLL